MFTVKHINHKGYEEIRPATNTLFFPRIEEPDYEEPPHFTFYNPDLHMWVDITEGTVFVMNEEGKTVGNYGLG